jgi:alpha-ketoglutarate-dependent taurine dioxygenase
LYKSTCYYQRGMKPRGQPKGRMISMDNSSESDISISSLMPNCDVLRIINGNDKLTPSAWINQNRQLVENYVDRYGGVLLRGFKIHSLSEFSQCASLVTPKLQEYMFRSTPRSNIGKNIYTSTIYPANREIALHNEFSYFHQWPNRILFYCSVPATVRGETPIANGAQVYNRLPKDIIDKFEQKKVMYVRNYSEGLDLSWQEVFQTDSTSTVSDYCDKNSINYEWYNNGNSLRTSHIAQATITHTITNQKVWFNQAHLFHFSNLDHETQNLILEVCSKETIPRNSFYGDGSDIEVDYLTAIRECYQKEKITFKWQRGDIMILDNTILAHGRATYSGERRVAAAMG